MITPYLYKNLETDCAEIKIQSGKGRRENSRGSSQALRIVPTPRDYLLTWIPSCCLSMKLPGILDCTKTCRTEPNYCSQTTRHFKQATTVKRKPGTKNSHEIIVQATLCFRHPSHTYKPPSLSPQENKQSTVTNHFGQLSVNLTKL